MSRKTKTYRTQCKTWNVLETLAVISSDDCSVLQMLFSSTLLVIGFQRSALEIVQCYQQIYVEYFQADVLSILSQFRESLF